MEKEVQKQSGLIKVKNFFNNANKTATKRFNNFRFTAIYTAVVSMIVIFVGVLNLIAYEFAGPKGDTAQITAFNDRPIAGCVFFLANLFAIILAVFGTYLLFPAIKNKERIAISKIPLVLAVVNAAFQIVSLIFTCILLGSEEVIYTRPAFLVAIVFAVVAIVGSVFVLYPLIRCLFYMPAIKNSDAK